MSNQFELSKKQKSMCNYVKMTNLDLGLDIDVYTNQSINQQSIT